MPVQTLITPSGSAISVRPNKHNILIVDQSGSLSWAIKDLAVDTTKRINDLPENDYLSLAYFSGEGDHRWLVKGLKIDAQAKRIIATIIEHNFYSRNTTCFSEVLSTTEQVIKDIAPFSNVISLAFMSDGHPVVSSLEKETKAIFAAIEKIKGHLSDAVVIGYGDYYNRELLSKMSQALGASFVHAGKVEVVGEEFEKVSRRKSSKRVKVEVPKGASVVFTVNENGVSTFEVKDSSVFVPEGSRVMAYADKSITDSTVNKSLDNSESNLYAGALALCQVGMNDKALEVVGEIGDVAVANALGNAITNEELGKAETLLKSALSDVKMRFTAGKKVGCVPKDDAFDLLDCLNLLQADKDALFYPYHPNFDYKRIGRKSKTKEGYPKFKADEAQGVPFSRLVWNESRLNLSVGISIRGQVELNGEIPTGLTSPYQTNIFRTYSFVANGFPNVRLVPVSCSKSTYERLLEVGAFSKNGGWDESKVFMLKTDSLPVCNRMKARGKKSAKDLALKTIQSLLLAGELKAYKSLLKELDPEKDYKKDLSLTDAQRDFLVTNGIVNGSYNPPKEQEPATDVMFVREFEIKVAKFSTLPSLNEVRKQKDKGKFTPSGELVYAGLEAYENNAPKQKLDAITWLRDQIEDISSSVSELRKDIQTAKFSLIMGNTWFDDLPRSEPKLKVNHNGKDYDVEFRIETVEEKI